MKNILLFGTMCLAIVNSNEGFATDDLNDLLGGFADLDVQSTPVKSSYASGNNGLLSPSVRDAISDFVQKEKDLGLQKAENSRLTNELDEKTKKLKDQIEEGRRLAETLVQSEQTSAERNTQIKKLTNLQTQIVERFKSLANSSGEIEAKSALKGRLANFVNILDNEINANISENYNKDKDSEKLLIEKSKLKSLSFRFIRALLDSDGRESIGLSQVYSDELVLFQEAKSSKITYPELSQKTQKKLRSIFTDMLAAEDTAPLTASVFNETPTNDANTKAMDDLLSDE